MSSEMLSAALDGECSPEELDQLLSEVEQSPELKRQWSRLCVARDALAGARLRADQPCIAQGVMSAIGSEAPSDKVVAFVPKRSRFSWRPVIGLATAASVASIAFVLGYHSPSVPPMVTAKAPVAVLASPVASKGVVDASQLHASAADARQASADSLEEWDSRQLNSYLMDYSSYRAGAGMSDTLGYARFAAHTAEYNPDR